jgi:NAD(P)-dependent dehydrogenase (short-subunit alcohol dehydrogenase family)
MESEKSVLQKFDLHGQVAVVTGGAGLLGRQFCRTLAQAGAKVICADADIRSAKAFVDEQFQKGLEIYPFQVDVTQVDENRKMAADTVSRFNRLDILVTCAAVDPKVESDHAEQWDHSFEEYPISLWQHALDVNLSGSFLSAQACIPKMLQNQYGVVVMVSSMYGLAAPDQRIYRSDHEKRRFKPAAYPATKAAILGLVKYLASYYAGQPLRVNALSPGGVYNGQSDEFIRNYSSRSMLGRMAHVDEMNGALLFLASPASSYMNGANLVVDGGWTAW